MEIYNNMEHEKKLIELLGYNLIGPDNSNRYIIVDDNNTDIGFIQYKKIYNQNKRKGLPKTFGYHMEICSETVNYNQVRKILNENDDISLDSSFEYEFDLKGESGTVDHIELALGKYLNLKIWSEKHGYIDFNLRDGLFLKFQSVTENFNIEETVIYSIDDKDKTNIKKEYTYQIGYSNKEQENLDITQKKEITRLISGKTSSLYKGDQINLLEQTWENHKLVDSEKSQITGTIEEMMIGHQMGIDAFNHFRFLISQILPFKQDIIDIMLKKSKLNKSIVSIFDCNNKKENIKKELIKK